MSQPYQNSDYRTIVKAKRKGIPGDRKVQQSLEIPIFLGFFQPLITLLVTEDRPSPHGTIERLLEQNTEQRETLTRLMAQGYIDQVLYNSEDLFERFVDHIQVYSRHEVGFVMKCGLTFKEMI